MACVTGWRVAPDASDQRFSRFCCSWKSAPNVYVYPTYDTSVLLYANGKLVSIYFLLRRIRIPRWFLQKIFASSMNITCAYLIFRRRKRISSSGRDISSTIYGNTIIVRNFLLAPAKVKNKDKWKFFLVYSYFIIKLRCSGVQTGKKPSNSTIESNKKENVRKLMRSCGIVFFCSTNALSSPVSFVAQLNLPEAYKN